jgi:hypothetical protein
MREGEGRGKLFDKSSRRKESGKELKLRRQVKRMRREYTKWDGGKQS